MRIALISMCCLLGGLAWGQNFGNVSYTPTPIVAKVAPYTVKADLSNVVNRKILPKLSKEQLSALAAHGFVARTSRLRIKYRRR
jgi:hypothetical protein